MIRAARIAERVSSNRPQDPTTSGRKQPAGSHSAVKKLPFVVLWAVAFGYVEAALVEYLRALYYPLSAGGFTFPLLTLEQFAALGTEHYARLVIELGRELCTLIMLAAVGFMAARNVREAVAHFMIAFGVWDIFYYVWLVVFLNWPPSIWTWDLLFLVPLPWVGPVIAPVIISVVMIAAGVVVLYYEDRGTELHGTPLEWGLLVLGGLIVITAFCWDYENIMAGGLPNPFNWPVFFLGLGLAAITFLRALRRNLRQS